MAQAPKTFKLEQKIHGHIETIKGFQLTNSGDFTLLNVLSAINQYVRFGIKPSPEQLTKFAAWGDEFASLMDAYAALGNVVKIEKGVVFAESTPTIKILCDATPQGWRFIDADDFDPEFDTIYEAK